jgi:hypothetical protein
MKKRFGIGKPQLIDCDRCFIPLSSVADADILATIRAYVYADDQQRHIILSSSIKTQGLDKTRKNFIAFAHGLLQSATKSLFQHGIADFVGIFQKQ